MRKVFFFSCDTPLGPMYYTFESLEAAVDTWNAKHGSKSPVQEGWLPEGAEL